jgi:hypothetical protein
MRTPVKECIISWCDSTAYRFLPPTDYYDLHLLGRIAVVEWFNLASTFLLHWLVYGLFCPGKVVVSLILRNLFAGAAKRGIVDMLIVKKLAVFFMLIA